MGISELGYLIFGSADVAGWRTLGEKVIGFAVTAVDAGLYFKMDDRDFRIAVVPDAAERLIASGWEVANQATFEKLRAELTAAGTTVTRGDATERTLRKVQDFFWFDDPAGNRVEVYWGFISSFTPFRAPPTGPSAFNTAGIGLGHVVLPAPNLDETQDFYAERLGFALSDIITMKFGPADVRVNFNHCVNVRQHSMALADMPSANGCVHFCVEVATLKDVGMALDRVQAAGHPLVLTLGQHVNDDCVSFYFLSPHGFMIEIGYDSMVKDWSRHSVFETTKASHWGHHFVLNI